jgi:hypothetical protein
MQLSVLQSQTRFITNTDTTSYSNDDLNANLTRWAHLFTTEIIDSQDCWDFQGEISTADLVADQREYLFPTDILKIKRIEIYLGDDWRVANFIDENEVSTIIGDEAKITEKFSNEEPYVSLFDKSLFIFSGTIAEKTAGIKIWYTEEIVGVDAAGDDITSFTTATDTPNIIEAFQRGLVHGASKDWFQKYQIKDRAQEQDAELEKIIARMRQFYGKRSERGVVLKGASSLENYE